MAGGKGAGGKKADQKAKEKVIQDKTFGLKNKNKSSKVQKYVATVKQQVNNANAPKKRDLPPLSKKEEEAKKKEELAQIFKPVTQQQKVAAGVDPKSVLCQFYKQGLCTKGAKCKFSHDVAVQRKVEKIDLYTDQREAEEKAKDVMDGWDQKKLEEVVGKKHQDNRTEIVCKFFLAAIETKKYGWFWECPNGGDQCPYRHALPPGFVLKSKEKKVEEDDTPKITIEEEIEEERRRLVGEGTPVTLERFLKWKADKRARLEKERADREKDQPKEKMNRTMMNGREMFVFNPDLFVDDDEAFDATEYEHEEEQFDPSVPHNIITATATSITRTAVNPTKEEEERNGHNNEENVGAVDESLFADAGDIPDVDDD